MGQVKRKRKRHLLATKRIRNSELQVDRQHQESIELLSMKKRRETQDLQMQMFNQVVSAGGTNPYINGGKPGDVPSNNAWLSYASSPLTPSSSHASEPDIILEQTTVVYPGQSPTDLPGPSRHPSPSASPSYKCNICGKSYQTPYTYSHHMEHYHQNLVQQTNTVLQAAAAQPQEIIVFAAPTSLQLSISPQDLTFVTTNSPAIQSQPLPVPTGIFTSQFYDEQAVSSMECTDITDEETNTGTSEVSDVSPVMNGMEVSASSAGGFPVISNIMSLSDSN